MQNKKTDHPILGLRNKKHESAPKKRGRPRKTNVKTEDLTPQLEADSPQSLLPSEGQTKGNLVDSITAPLPVGTIEKETLLQRVSNRLEILDRFLTPEIMLSKLATAKLRDLAVYESILVDKYLTLRGEPTVLVGATERSQLSEALPRILAVLERRGIIATATERKLEIQSRHGQQPIVSEKDVDADGLDTGRRVIETLGRTIDRCGHEPDRVARE